MTTPTLRRSDDVYTAEAHPILTAIKWVFIILILFGMVWCWFDSVAHSQDVKPAFPDGVQKPKLEKHLRIRYFKGDDVVGTCQATSDLHKHVNCQATEGRLDDFLDAVTEFDAAPCPDPKMNNAMLKHFEVQP